MSAIRTPGKINENTTLIDIGIFQAVYLIRGTRTCLIDAGTHTEANNILMTLKEIDAFPPDLIITTHPHFDHSQGIPVLRREASRQEKKIEILASHEAIPLLADAHFNDIFGNGPHESVQEVSPVREGDTLDLGGITLRFYELPGHCQGHIGILDEKNRNIFVGDAIGYKFSDDLFIPPFMPPTWDTNAFLSSVNKLRQIHYETLCLAHFGYIYGSEAKSILEEALDIFNTWWQWYEMHADKLDDIDFLVQAMRDEINPSIDDDLILSNALNGLAIGYKMYRNTH